MDERLERYDTAELWVYRLFAWRPGLRLPAERLHFVPVPASIPRERWLPTTVRIQHLSGSTAERRAARHEKYRQADPGRVHQRDYDALLAEPGHSRPWAARPDSLPVLAPLDDEARPLDLHALDLDAPVLSAIVISRNDEERIERALGAVVGQEVPEPFEVICVVSGTDRTAAIVRERFPGVHLVKLAGAVLPGAARNAGVRVARGDFVSFPGSHTELRPAVSPPGCGRTRRATRWSPARCATAPSPGPGGRRTSSTTRRRCPGARRVPSGGRRSTAPTSATSSRRPAGSATTCAPARTR